MLTRTIDGQVKDVPYEKVTAENFIVPDNGKKLYWVKIEVKHFSQSTGEKLSRPQIQSFGVKTYRLVKQHLQRQGYTIDVLYDPSEYNTAKAKELAERKALNAKAAAEKRKAEINEAIKEALADRDKEIENLKKQIAEQSKAAKSEGESKETAKKGK